MSRRELEEEEVSESWEERVLEEEEASWVSSILKEFGDEVRPFESEVPEE